MPLARIRSFDPEAIAFLAAQLAQSGYTLQFVRPDETGLEPADLELTVTRRDLDEALRVAQSEAEQLGVDVTVIPGVMPAVEPVVAPKSSVEDAEISVPVPFQGVVEMPPRVEVPVAAVQATSTEVATRHVKIAEIAKASSERTAHALGRGLGKAVGGFEAVTETIGRGLTNGRENLVEIGDSTTGRLNRWKVRFLTARALRREAKHRELRLAYVQKLPARPRPLWLRERIYKGAALAAVLATAALVGWTLAGYAGPANPVGKGTGLSTVQEQVPFGPASIKAPAVAATPVRVSEKSVPASRPKPAIVRDTTVRRSVAGEKDYGPEVIVRHFDQKPASVQAKSRESETRNGVKIISEE
ncbi:MAG: hypothetical protein ROO76_05405 [Terriglobia bacterium]|jgi:hypothetical protein|nr:hypothetical protein [Terriglobia bacterium]